MSPEDQRDKEIEKEVGAHLKSANRDLAHFEMAVVDVSPPIHACACGFTTGSSGDPAQLTRHLQTERSAEARAARLRAMLRAMIAERMMGDLRGGELFKEIWELCRSDAEQEVVRDELRTLIRGLLSPSPSSTSEIDA